MKVLCGDLLGLGTSCGEYSTEFEVFISVMFKYVLIIGTTVHGYYVYKSVWQSYDYLSPWGCRSFLVVSRSPWDFLQKIRIDTPILSEMVLKNMNYQSFSRGCTSFNAQSNDVSVQILKYRECLLACQEWCPFH